MSNHPDPEDQEVESLADLARETLDTVERLGRLVGSLYADAEMVLDMDRSHTTEAERASAREAQRLIESRLGVGRDEDPALTAVPDELLPDGPVILGDVDGGDGRDE